jgi:hypothetical protein
MGKLLNVTIGVRVFKGVGGAWLWAITLNGDQIMGKSGFPTEKAARDDMREWAHGVSDAMRKAAE